MGIKNLHSFFRKKIPNVYETVPIENLKGKKISIDTSIFMCKFKNTYGSKWLNGFYQFIMYLLQHEIDFIFVLDTKPPPEKSHEREQRSISREKNKERIDLLIQQWMSLLEENPTVVTFPLSSLETKYPELHAFFTRKHSLPDIKLQDGSQYLGKLQKNIIRITSADFDLLKRMFDIMNVNYYYADSEAEGTCSLMNRKGIVDGVLTEDTDVIAYGAPVMYHNLSYRSGTIQKLEVYKILDMLNITFEQLRDFCILCGTDYNSNLEKIGPVRSMEMIRKYGSLEEMSSVVNMESINYPRVRILFDSEQYALKEFLWNDYKNLKINTEELQHFCFYNNITYSKDKANLFFSSANFF